MIKEKMQKATDRLNMLNALTKLKQDLDNLGPVPYNVERKTVYSYWHNSELKNTPVPRDLALYDYIIKFFNVIAKFQDSGVLKLELFNSKNTEFAKKLISHVSNAGRCLYGYNRTKEGENVTEHNVYLGGIYGMKTDTINFWKNVKFENKQFDDFSKYAIQICQIKSFVDSHIESMKKLISDIMIEEQQYKNNIFDKIAIRKQENHR